MHITVYVYQKDPRKHETARASGLPPSLPKAPSALSLLSTVGQARDRMDEVRELFTADRCRVGGGRSHTSTIFVQIADRVSTKIITRTIWDRGGVAQGAARQGTTRYMEIRTQRTPLSKMITTAQNTVEESVTTRLSPVEYVGSTRTKLTKDTSAPAHLYQICLADQAGLSVTVHLTPNEVLQSPPPPPPRICITY